MNVRLTIFLVVVLALIVGAVFIVRIQPRPAKEAELRDWFYRLNSDDIVQVGVTNLGKTESFVKKEDTWTFANTGDAVNLDRWSGITFLLGGPRAERVLLQQIDDPAKYGLDKPLTIVNIGLKDGRNFRFDLGDLSPTQDKQYAQIEGNPKLFLIVSNWGEVLSRLVNDPPFLWVYEAKPKDIISLAATHQGQTTSYKLTDDNKWFFDDGKDTPVDQEKWNTIFQSLLKMPGHRQIRDDSVTPIDLAQLGLDNPQTKLSIGLTGGFFIEIEVGKTTPEGLQYVRLMTDQPKVFLVKTSFTTPIVGLVTQPPRPQLGALPRP